MQILLLYCTIQYGRCNGLNIRLQINRSLVQFPVRVQQCCCASVTKQHNWRYVTLVSGYTVASGIVVVGVVVGVCNRSQMRTSKCTCLIFGVSIGLDPG